MANELYHHGIKGMRWGVRRTPEELGRARKRRKKSFRKAKNTGLNISGFRNSRALKKARERDINGMSTAQLKKETERLRLEREYRELTRLDTQKGRQWVNDVMTYGGWAIAAGTFIYKNRDILARGSNYIKKG